MTTLVGLGGSFLITGLGAGLIETSDLLSGPSAFFTFTGAAGLAGTLSTGLATFFSGLDLAGGRVGLAGFLAIALAGLAAFLGAGFPPAGRAGLTTVFPVFFGTGLAAGFAAFLGAGFPFLGAGFEAFFFLIAIDLAFF
jgi:hypothetical protein